MSYSFSVKARKADILAKVDDQLAQVVEGQPVHSNDIGAARQVVDSLLNVCEDGTYNVSVSGSLTWRNEGEFIGANLSVSVQPAQE